jgi:hypothetical protein
MGPKWRIWRNLLVSGINAGLEQKRFSLDPNNCPLNNDPINPRHSEVGYWFELSGGIPARASALSIGFDEIRIAVAAWPIDHARSLLNGEILSPKIRLLVGDGYAYGWLERRTGKWLQVHNNRRGAGFVNSRRHRAATLAAIKAEPNGYADNGKFFL